MQLRRAYFDFLRHGSLPGYRQLPLQARLLLNMRALLSFLCSAEFLRMLICITVWQLTAYIVIWTFDLGTRRAALLLLLCCLWVWPWLAAARRRHIDLKLGGRWES